MMKALYELKETLCQELDEIARKPEMSAGDLEAVHKLTDTIKNIDKICMLEEEGGYSGDSYSRGSSYTNRGKHYVRGHYSRDGYGRDGMYSRHDAKDGMMMQLEDMMRSAGSEREREAIRRCMEQLERE